MTQRLRIPFYKVVVLLGICGIAGILYLSSWGLWNKYMKEGATASDNGNYSAAEEAFTKAKLLVFSGPRLASTLVSLGDIYRIQGQHDKAEAAFRRAVAINVSSLGMANQETARSFNSLAVLLLDQARYAEAEPLFLQAVTAYQVAPPIEEGLTAKVAKKISWIYGRISRSEKKRYEVKQLKNELANYSVDLEYANNNGDLAAVFHNLGDLYHEQNILEKAEHYHKLSLDFDIKLFALRDPSLAQELHSLVYSTGNSLANEELSQRTKRLMGNSSGSKRESLANTLNSLAEVYRDQGRYREAEPQYIMALAIIELIQGVNTQNYALVVTNLGLMYTLQDRYAEAEPRLLQALAIREKILNPEHDDLAHSYNNLALLYDKQGRYSDAVPLYQHALAIREKVLGETHPKTILALDLLSKLFIRQQQFQSAEPLIRRLLTIYERQKGQTDPSTLDMLQKLIFVSSKQEKDAEVLLLYERLIPRLEELYGVSSPTLIETLTPYAALLRKANRVEEAIQVENRIKALTPNGLSMPEKKKQI
jgi:tetratricopeptide (TPR) repeat protein